MAGRQGQTQNAGDGVAFEHRTPEHASSLPARISADKRPHSAGSSREFGEFMSDDDPKSPRSSFSYVDPEPGFSVIDGDVGGPTGLNETKVDIVCVPCPGASTLDTWCRDPFPEDYFKYPVDDDLRVHPTVTELAGDAILTPAINRHLPRAPYVWVRQGIRKSVNTARVMLYRHRALSDGMTLDDLAQDLLDQLQSARGGLRSSRPLFFIAHSIGGLVVKLALRKASQIQKYRPVIYTCHGVAFFATPHRGSSYLNMRNVKDSIQRLLHLQRPLPQSLMDELRLDNKALLKLNDQFINLASELRVWSFYETIDSKLSGSNRGWAGGVQFGAPIVSIKSGLLLTRREFVFAVESDHAHCASFGPSNPKTMITFLEHLAQAVEHAVSLSDEYVHHPLRLKEEVKVEIIGFYEDRDTEVEAAIRLYHTKHHFSDFLNKGPERCLEERLSKKARKRRSRSRHKPQAKGAPEEKGPEPSGLGILTNVSQRIFGASTEAPPSTEAQESPDIVVTLPSARPSDLGAEGSKSFPPEGFRRPHSLTVPAWSAPNFRRPSSRGSDGTTSTMSEPVGHEISPTSVDPASTRRSEMDALKREAEQLERVSALHEMTAGFSRPDTDMRRFMWIHLPFTNPLWVKDVFDKIAETNELNTSKLFSKDDWVSKHIQGRHSQSQPAFVKPACNFVQAEAMTSARTSPNIGASPGTSPDYLYLYLPYLNFDTYSSVVQRRKVINRRLAHGRARPVPQDIHDLNLELKVIWEYLGYDPPLNARRTLDQFGYPSLRDTNARDDDQMLYKLTKADSHLLGVSLKGQMELWANNTRRAPAVRQETSYLSAMTGATTRTEDTDAMADNISDTGPESDLKDGKVLMVDQLWLWAIDTTTLTTFFPKRESSPIEGTLFQQADLRNSVYNELNGDLTGRTDNALDLAAFVALHAVTILLDRSSHPDLDIFRIFEEAIGLLTERMTFNLKEFRMQTFQDFPDDDSGDDDPEENSAATIKQRYKLELEKAERQNRENTSAVLELRDMEDELTTLLRLFETQETNLKTMRAFYQSDKLKDITHNGQGYLDQALDRIDEFKQQTNEMQKRVDITRKDYEKILEMAQRQAQVDDVRWSRLQTELASSQNLSVMIFTIFTVIFLPLSFFTSVFGMNTAEWQEEVPTLSFIGEVSLPVSAFVIIASLVGAFSPRVQSFAYKTFRAMARALRLAARLFAEPEAAQARKARDELERAEEKARRRKDRAYDFWATVRRERGDSRYHIPELNRIREPKGKAWNQRV